MLEALLGVGQVQSSHWKRAPQHIVMLHLLVSQRNVWDVECEGKGEGERHPARMINTASKP